MATTDRSRNDAAIAALRREARAVPEFAAFVAMAGPLVATAPRGDGHPVVVLPGLATDDTSTMPMRWLLRRLGYKTSGWDLGVNRGPTPRVTEGMGSLLDGLVAKYHQRVSIIGWSLGGAFALGLARRAPDDIRQVITLGSPLVGAPEPPPQIPVSSLYSKSDSIVPWRYSLLPDRPLRENIEVRGSHLGLGHNPAVLAIVVERLALPDGQWRPYTGRRGRSGRQARPN